MTAKLSSFSFSCALDAAEYHIRTPGGSSGGGGGGHCGRLDGGTQQRRRRAAAAVADEEVVAVVVAVAVRVVALAATGRVRARLGTSLNDVDVVCLTLTWTLMVCLDDDFDGVAPPPSTTTISGTIHEQGSRRM
jgi:hypothetical protein